MRKFAVLTPWLALLLLFLASLSPPVAAPAHAATLADEQVGFRADRVLQIDGKTYAGEVWAMPGEERHEQAIGGFRPIFLLRDASPLGEVVLPQLKTIVEFALPPELRLLRDPELERRPIGSAVVNGVTTTKYAIDEAMPDGGGRAQGTLWLSRDRIPIRLLGTFISRKGKPTRVSWELSHVRIGPQPEFLFEVPRGYSKLPPEAVAPLLGLKLKSAERRR